jgi:hypothetical protein
METKPGLTFLMEKNLLAPTMFLHKPYKRDRYDRSPFPNVNEVVGQVIAQFPDFAQKEPDFVLYETMHSNGFAYVNAQVRKSAKMGGSHYLAGGVNGIHCNRNPVPSEYIPKFEGLLDKAGLVHLNIKPDELSLRNETVDPSDIIHSMKIAPEFQFALIRRQPRSDIAMYNNLAYVQGPSRLWPSADETKKDAISVAAITQALNETFTEDFLRYEESFDDGEDLSDFCM